MTGPNDDRSPPDSPPGDAQPVRALLALLLAHQRRDWLQEGRASVEAYLTEQPMLREDPEAILDLIYHEILLREEHGESPRLEEYLRRFPELAPQLELQFEVEGALGPRTLMGTGEGATLSAEAAPPPAEFARRAVPGYELLGELGRGGMGVVYKARQVRLNRIVALKMILASDHAGPEAAARFVAEAEVVARLSHPHIIQIFAFGDHDGHPYFEMEYAADGSLADRLDGTPWPAREAARLIETLARAIHAVHRLGIVHRDLKPANILLTADGTPKVADFGLAKLLDVESGLTRTDHILGSPSYMAPEQAGGGAGPVGPAADVHALGAILYELLTGRPPFRAATALETLEQVKFDEPVPPTRLQPKVPRDLETICLKCLNKEPARRYTGADAVAEDLRRFVAGESIRARPVSAAERAWRWGRREPALATLGASIALLLLVVVVGTLTALVSLRRERDRALLAEKQAVERLWKSDLDQARAKRLGGQIGQRFEGLSLLAEAARIRPDPELRDEAIACLALVDLRVERVWDGCPHRHTGIAFDADLKRYARDDDGGVISVRRVADDAETLRLPAPEAREFVGTLAFSPDGRFLAATHVATDNQRLRHRVWDLSRAELLLDVPTNMWGPSMAFSPDGRRLAVSGPDRSLVLYELPACRELTRLELLPSQDQIAFHPLGRLLAIASATNNVVEVRDGDTGAVVERLAQPSGVRSVAWSHDGSLLAAGCDDLQISLWETSSFQPRGRLRGHNGAIVVVAFHPSDGLLMSASWDGTTRLWDRSTGKPLVTAEGPALRFGPTGERMAFRDGQRVGIWEVAGGRECRLLHRGRVAATPPQGGARGNVGVDINSEGRLLASAGWDGVSLWDLRTDQEVAHLPLGNSGTALFHPRDGSLITYGASGLQRWPIRHHPGPEGARDTLDVGPPVMFEQFSGPSNSFYACLSPAGHLLAVGDRPNRQAIVFDVDRPGDRTCFRDQPGAASVALSPDGRWVAAGNQFGSEVKVWERATGDLLARLPGSQDEAASACVAFLPDGQRLVTGLQSEYQFWRTGSWTLERTIPRDRLETLPGPIAFTRDGRLLAIARSLRKVQLIETAKGRALATLSAADPHVVLGLSFSSDGSLLAVATDSTTIQVWDLRQVRRDLAAMRLDWDFPPLPPPRE